MQKHWDKLWEKIVETDKQFDDYLQNSGLSASGMKKTKILVKAWNDLKKLAEEFGGKHLSLRGSGSFGKSICRNNTGRLCALVLKRWHLNIWRCWRRTAKKKLARL